MQDSCLDLWGVWRDVDAFREKARSEPFAQWTDRFLVGQREVLGRPDSVGSDGGEGVVHTAGSARDAALAYVLTGEESFAARASAALEAVGCASGEWLLPGHSAMYPADRADLVTAETAKSCATALSWVWPALDDDARQRVAGMIAERGGEPIYGSAVRGCWWANALNSNWTAVLNGGLAFSALALRAVNPDAAATWLDYARARVVEMLDLAADEGAGVEGAGYWLYCFGSIQDVAEALLNVTGDDLYSHPFWDRCSRFLPYLALPDFSAWVNYADTAYHGLGGSHVFQGVAARKRDGLAQWFADRILEVHGGIDWRNLIYYDESVAPTSIDTEPCCRLFSSIHLASLRSGWDRDAVHMLFKGGSNAWSHTHLDLNSFFLTAYGERLATEPGPAPYSLHYWHSIEPPVSTAWHNCIVVDGGHQRVPAQYAMSFDLEEAGDCYSRLDDYLDSDTITMVRGDATTAYGDTLERAWRDVVYLKPDVFVIFDDLLAHPVRCQRNFEWMLHSECTLTPVTDGIEARGDRARLLIRPVFPQGWEHKTIEGRVIPKAENKALHALSIRPHWHHKWNVDPNRSPYPHWDARGDAAPLHTRACQFLVVLSALKADAHARFALEPVEQGRARGVHLRGDDEDILVVFNPARDAVDVKGLTTDAAKVVVRCHGGRVSWALVRGTQLVWHGQTLFFGDTPVSRTGAVGV